MYYFRHFATPHQDPAAISHLARSMGYYKVESRGIRFRHLTKLWGVTVDVIYKSASVQVIKYQPRGRKVPSYYQKESDLARYHQDF